MIGDALTEETEADLRRRAAWAEYDDVANCLATIDLMREKLRASVEQAIKHREKAETDGAACITYEFCARAYLDEVLSILPAIGVRV